MNAKGEIFASFDDLKALAQIRGDDYYVEAIVRGRICQRCQGVFFTLETHDALRKKWAEFDQAHGLGELMAKFKAARPRRRNVRLQQR